MRYMAKESHARKTACGFVMVTAYDTIITTDEELDENAWPYYFKIGAEDVLPAPVISFRSPYVTISCKDAEKIFYTTDGSEPNMKSTKYSSKIELLASTTIKAVGYDGKSLGAVSTKKCEIESSNIE